ncbi:hypothetical protein [Achromobacter sp. DH1f]|uniref:hypothetical protein n=1 Tax=Achromobacter sp. DH1f TaxID=1397275 RepID=UPI001E4AA7BD|nr:hypothetical protein [Achromobacter sp. DH1f]
MNKPQRRSFLRLIPSSCVPLCAGALLGLTLISVPQTSAARGSGYSSSHGSSQSYHAPSAPRSTMPSYGTGSKSSSTGVHGYTNNNGTYVAPHQRSTPDSSLNNNWSTKGNTNPYTGQPGTKRGSPWGN